jgi:hypothetical protein
MDRLSLDRPTGDIVILCTPENAKVFLDGIYIGRAKKFSSDRHPLRAALGAHVLKFELEKYQLELREVVTSETQTILKVEMQLRPEAPEDEDEKAKK